MTATGSAAAGAAILTGSFSTHGSVMRRTPLVPASIADQVDAASPPSGVVAPSPVTTTLTRSLLPTATPPTVSPGGPGAPTAEYSNFALCYRVIPLVERKIRVFGPPGMYLLLTSSWRRS